MAPHHEEEPKWCHKGSVLRTRKWTLWGAVLDPLFFLSAFLSQDDDDSHQQPSWTQFSKLFAWPLGVNITEIYTQPTLVIYLCNILDCSISSESVNHWVDVNGILPFNFPAGRNIMWFFVSVSWIPITSGCTMTELLISSDWSHRTRMDCCERNMLWWIGSLVNTLLKF